MKDSHHIAQDAAGGIPHDTRNKDLNRKFSLIVILLLAVVLTGCSTARKFKVMLPAGWIGMENLAGDVYVDPTMKTEQRRNLLAEVAKAKTKTIAIWGSIETKPEIYACSSETCFQSFGGSTNRANAIGNSKILLSPRALNAAMISHEWSHNELYQRVGGFMPWRRIPNWFDEGVAVIVSADERHGEAAWLEIDRNDIETPGLDVLTTHHEWIAAVKKYRNPQINPDNLSVVYATAGHEVRVWYKTAGQRGLLYVIAQVKDGAPFDKAYEQARTGI
jgi:hypothetical protein